MYKLCADAIQGVVGCWIMACDVTAEKCSVFVCLLLRGEWWQLSWWLGMVFEG